MSKKKKPEKVSRRKFLRRSAAMATGAIMVLMIPKSVKAHLTTSDTKTPGKAHGSDYDWSDHYWTYLIDINKCIGCGNCVRACKRENGVHADYFRTWVEHYIVTDHDHDEEGGKHHEHVYVYSPKGGEEGFYPKEVDGKVMKSFFVPKICNHCRHTPCIQVCPVHASFSTKDGVVLVDKKVCIGCAYCVQACPYGSRYIDPATHTADKCTWCYHRITRGLLPACVTVCPTNTRQFGDLREVNSKIKEVIETQHVAVLKQELHTEPFCFYIGYDHVIK